jgi:alpha-mannosidase
MPFNWRKKISFMASLPHAGTMRYELRIHKGKKADRRAPAFLKHILDPRKGLITSLDAGGGRECLSGPLLQPLVVEDDADSWGAGRWRYREVAGVFQPKPEGHVIIESGPVRTIVQSVFHYSLSSVQMRTISYASWPVVEYQLRINWAEQARRLKLSIPTRFRNDAIYCEVPGGALSRPADGEEHVHGRWCMLEGILDGKRTGFAVVNSGQHGFDFKDGEIRLSILRSAAYCHDQGFKISGPVARKYMDQGIHEIRLLVTAGDADEVLRSLTGLADWLSAPPAVYSHLPIGVKVSQSEEFLRLVPRNIRLLATKQSEDGKALILRLQETVGIATKAGLALGTKRSSLPFSFKPFEIKTIRLEKSGRCREVGLIREL